MQSPRKRSYSTAELAEGAAGLRRLVELIDAGEMTAPKSVVYRLQGALLAFEALAGGGSLTVADLLARLGLQDRTD